MNGTLVPTPIFEQHTRDAMEVIVGYTDDVWTVSLVEGSFDPSIPTAWPTASAHFTPLVSDDTPQLHFDAASGKYYLVAPEPASGWQFSSSTITTSISVGGYIVKCGTNLIGANTIPTVTITADSQNITLPYVSVEAPTRPWVSATSPTNL